MVKKVINVGVEGNDATGDPLREAFIKTNENFNELYSFIGQGDGISFTALTDTPNALEPNTVFIVNDAGTAIIGKGIEAGTGIDINLTDPNNIIISNIGASLLNDPAPALSNTLDASTFGIARLGDPDPLVASNLNVSLSTFGISKGYADDRYVRRGGDYAISTITKGGDGRLTVVTSDNHRIDSGDLIRFSGVVGMTQLNGNSYYARQTGLKSIELYNDAGLTTLVIGSSFGNYVSGGTVTVRTLSIATNPIAVPAGATGIQVPQKQEVVGRAGGVENQMQGPLLLAEDPDELSSPFTAATKNYVDTSSFASTVNLFVSTAGDDNRFEISPQKRGRALAYAFKSLNRAAQEAKKIIDAAALELGPYQKPIFYNNGTVRSTVSAVSVLGPDTFGLDITHGGTGTDPRQPPSGNFDIRAGLLIRGVISGAIGLIEDIGNIDVSTERYHIHYVLKDEDDNNIEYIVGEQLEYGEPVKAPNIAILVESGTYFDHFPIKVPDNVSIQGDELRRVILRPKFGRSASPSADLYFRRDTVIDGLNTATQPFGWHYLTDSTRNIYNKTVNNPGGFENARLILTNNKEFIQEEIIGFISATLDGLDYDPAEWSQDIGRVIDAVSYDMAVGSNFASIKAGMYYRRGPNGDDVLGFEKNAKLQTLTYLKSVLSGLVSSVPAAQDLIEDNMDWVIGILDNGLSAVPSSFVRPEPDNISSGVQAARNLIVNNTNFIKAEIIAFINGDYPNLVFDADVYRTNVQYIIDALYYDLTYQGNSQSINAGNSYSIDFVSAETTAIVAAYEYLKTMVFNISQNLPVTSPRQNDIAQVSGTAGTLIAASTARNLVDNVKTIINTGIAPSTVFPDTAWVSGALNSALTTLLTNRTSTQTNVINWVNSNFFIYNSALCRRDAGLIVDAIAFDITNGGYFKSLEAANSYFESASSLIAITTQLAETSAALAYLGTIAQRIVQKLPVLVSYQDTFNQRTTFGVSAEAGATTAIADLVELHLDVINQDSSFNPPLNNEDMDVFLMNNATMLRNFTVQGHGGFMCVLDPEGQIITKSPYVQVCGSFTRSTNSQRFSGGQFVDGFCGNLECEIVTRVDSTTLEVSGLIYRKPQTPCNFVYQGVRFQVDFISNYNSSTGTATLNLNPTTPDTNAYHGLGGSVLLPSVGLEIIKAGNRSMLGNDFTQINDLGYGLIATNQGLIESVSVFTYYCHTAYYSLNGGQIRSLNGSCAYGNNALKAEGSDPLEVPNSISLANDMVQIGFAYTQPGFPNLQENIVFYVDGLSYTPYNVSELEIDHGGTIVRYEVINASTGGLLPPNVVALNLSTAGNNNLSSTGLFANVADNTPVIIRSNQNFKFTNVNDVQPTRPSTSLQINNEPSIYRVLAYNIGSLPPNTAILTTRETYVYTNINVALSGGTVLGSGIIGDTQIRCIDITPSQVPFLTGKKFGWGDTIHTITGYQDSATTGLGYALIQFTPALTKSVGGYVSPPTLKAGLTAGVSAELTVNISTMRATGHDLLDIGTGSFADTNYPNNIFGSPSTAPNQSAEVQEVGKGRVFYVTTDQDGNFRVGEFFRVDQGTGTVTFAASISLSNLDGIGFKRGVSVSEFSTDDTMADNATDAVPVESAIRNYIDKRLGKTHPPLPSASGGTTVSPIGPGFIPRDGSLAATASINLGSQRIINLQAPASGSDGANKNYVDDVLVRAGTNRNGVLTFTMVNDSTLDAGAIDMNGNRIKSMRDPINGSDAATKQYVDSLFSGRDTVAELTDVFISSIAANNVLAWNSVSSKWVNTLLTNANISGTAAIDQSKLNLVDSTAAATAGTATKGIASFNSASFSAASGYISIRGGGITKSQIENVANGTVLGNNAGISTSVQELTFATVVQNGGGLFNSQFTSNGVLVRTGAGTYSTVPYQSTNSTSNNSLVQRDTTDGGFSAGTINGLQFNLSGNKVLDDISGGHELYNASGTLALRIAGTTSVSAIVYGSWTLATGATLEATYAADLAEYYEGDKTYDVGTVLMLGGDKEVTIAKGEGTRAVAGVVSNNAAYIMNGACPGEKNLIALQGRVPCKVVGKIKKGDLLVVSMIPGVAMASEDPKTGSIIGKAIQDYDSDRIGSIEVMVGKH